MAKISAQELAELVRCALEHVRRLVELGILEPHEEDGLFSSSDVHVVRLMAAFEEAGISLTSEEIKPRPSSPRGSWASCKRLRKRVVAGRSNGLVTASCFTSATPAGPS